MRSWRQSVEDKTVLISWALVVWSENTLRNPMVFPDVVNGGWCYPSLVGTIAIPPLFFFAGRSIILSLDDESIVRCSWWVFLFSYFDLSLKLSIRCFCSVVDLYDMHFVLPCWSALSQMFYYLIGRGENELNLHEMVELQKFGLSCWSNWNMFTNIL